MRSAAFWLCVAAIVSVGGAAGELFLMYLHFLLRYRVYNYYNILESTLKLIHSGINTVKLFPAMRGTGVLTRLGVDILTGTCMFKCCR